MLFVLKAMLILTPIDKERLCCIHYFRFEQTIQKNLDFVAEVWILFSDLRIELAEEVDENWIDASREPRLVHEREESSTIKKD